MQEAVQSLSNPGLNPPGFPDGGAGSGGKGDGQDGLAMMQFSDLGDCAYSNRHLESILFMFVKEAAVLTFLLQSLCVPRVCHPSLHMPRGSQSHLTQLEYF